VESVNGEKTLFRILTWLEGSFLSESLHTPELFMSFGAFLARLDMSLLGFQNYVYKARQYDWDIQHLELCEPYANHIADLAKRKLVDYFILQYRENVLPQLPSLRKSVIHNDANDWNVLVNGDDVVSIIDFGDTVHAPLINELAVAIAYAVMRKADPLSWAVYIIRGYHKNLSLERREVELLYYLVAARLCLSVCQSAIGRHRDPENSYVSISEDAAWELLHLWLTINPERARRTFGSAIGMEMYDDESVQEKVQKRHRFVNPIVSISYKEPVWTTKAAFQYMYDGYGNTYLDAYNNIPHVGHSHPKVVEAGQRQMAMLNTNTRYVFDLLSSYAERLLAHFPKPLSKVFFVNSGSAASDLAIRMARHYTSREAVMVMEHGYHGHTCTGIDISDYKFSNKKGPGRKPYILGVPMPDTFRGAYRDENAGSMYAADAMDAVQSFGQLVAAFIAEPVIGCGGQVPLAPGYLKSLYPSLRSHGAVCISDEVQTGFGRLGEHFWGFEA
jgi:Ser/Thr protein kinase RdoA (MazF antagonist)